MGQAKQREAQEKTQLDALSRVDLDRVALAVRKLFLAAGPSVGMDCYDHAVIGVELLRRLGIEARIAVGYAAWRVGEGDGDVVAHTPKGQVFPPQNGAGEGRHAVFHAWIEVAGRILDLTTYQLRRKAAELDALDGGQTQVDWAPDYLFLDKTEVQDYAAVAKLNAGLSYYERVMDLERVMMATAKPTDAEAVEMAMMVYQNPDAAVIGPNQTESSRKPAP